MTQVFPREIFKTQESKKERVSRGNYLEPGPSRRTEDRASGWKQGEKAQKKKADEIERNMQIYGDSSVYLCHFLFPLPQTQSILELTHTTLSVEPW